MNFNPRSDNEAWVRPYHQCYCLRTAKSRLNNCSGPGTRQLGEGGVGSCGLLRHSVQPLHRIFLCLISAAKNIPIEIKTAHTADRLVSGTPSGMRNPGSLPTIERRNLGKDTNQYQYSLFCSEFGFLILGLCPGISQFVSKIETQMLFRM